MAFRRIFKISLLTILVAYVIGGFNTHALDTIERITNYRSDIEVQKSGNLIITEDITVNAQNQQIVHGIYRDFPTQYGVIFPDAVKGFRIISVSKNGVSEPYKIKSESNGVRIYIGDASTTINPGIYSYKIIYETTDQLGFFKDYDELYWNVTGNGWSFPIDNSEVTVHLPEGISKNSIIATGFFGPKDSKASINAFNITESTVQGMGPRGLRSNEGYTISIKFPKGFVSEPPAYRKIIPAWLFSTQSFFGIMLFLVVGIYYFIIWHKFGRDETTTNIIPVQFEPPKGLTPAEVRFVNNMGTYDDICTSSAILNLAINGYLTIQNQDDIYKLYKSQKDTKDLVNEEEIIARVLFSKTPNTDIKETLNKYMNPGLKVETSGGFSGFVQKQIVNMVEMFSVKPDEPGTFTIQQSNYLTLNAMNTEVKNYFDKVGKRIIVSNRKYLLLALIPLSLFFIANIIYANLFVPSELFFMMFASFWNGIISIFVAVVISNWIDVFKKRKTNLLSGTVFLTLFLLPFVVVGAGTGTAAFTLIGYLGLVGTVALLFVYYKALPRRPKETRQTQDLIDGFKKFLVSQTEYIRGVDMDLPSKFSMYERYLPYAIALDVEPEWSSKFKSTISEMMKQGLNTNTTWYSSPNGFYSFSNFSIGGFSSSFSSSISAASVNPSSGSGSGGSSGGGGGGGGGGGW